MQQLNSQYCQQFNRIHNRVGPLVQGRFGSKIVEGGEYARTVIRYLALNPVVAKFCARPEEWPWSSYRFAVGLADAPPFLALHRVWEAFRTPDPAVGRERLRYFVTAGVDDVFPNPLLHGSEALYARVAPLLDPLAFHREYVRRQRFATRPSLGALFEGRHTRRDRQDAALAAFRQAYTLSEIGVALDRAPSTIWRWIQAAKRRQAEGAQVRPSKSSGEDKRGKIKT
jgi:hypothetical protein